MAKKTVDHTTRRLILATAAALVLIGWGALFLIAPVWQFPAVPAAAYVPPDRDQVQKTDTAQGNLLDVNRADAEALTELPGIGPAKAAAIVAYREEHGSFSSLEELEKVSGISRRMIESWSGLAFARTGDSEIDEREE